MTFYLIFIMISFSLIGVVNGFALQNFSVSFAYAGLALLIVVVVDIVVAAATRLFPEEKIDPFQAIFIPSARERKVLLAIGVRTWKDIIPETGKYLCHFAKDKIEKPEDNGYLLKFLRETIYAEAMHVISLFLGFAALLIPAYRFSIALPIALVNAFLQFLPVCAQRYNRPRLIALYQYNQRKGAIRQ